MIFVALVYKPAKQSLSALLDEYSDSIRKRVAEAENLRNEGEKIFKYYTKQHKDITKRMALISKHAEESIADIRRKADESLAEKIRIKRHMHKEKMALQEKEQSIMVRETIIQKAMTIASLYMSDVGTPNVSKADVTGLLDSVRDKYITFH